MHHQDYHPRILDPTYGIDGSVERILLHERYINLRYRHDPGDYLVIYIPKDCYIHLDGRKLPLKDIQFCDNVLVRCHQHSRYEIQMAQEIEVY